MSAPVTVTGGAGSLRVRLVELTLVARAFGELATALAVDHYELSGCGYRATPFGELPPADAAGRAELEQLLLAAGDQLLAAIGQAESIQRSVMQASGRYVALEQLLDGPEPWECAGRFVLGVGRVWDGTRHGDPLTPLEHEVTDHPGVVDAVVDGSGLMSDAMDVGRLPEGGAGLALAGTAAAGIPPRSLADLMRNLGERNRASGRGAPVDVRIMTAPDGTRSVVVNITGTRSWGYGGENPSDLLTNAKAVTGRTTAYEQGVFDAMRRAGVRPDDRVMLVGHSQGGMIAVNAARDARRTGRFDVTHVVTAGSPVGLTTRTMPSGVRVLALENSGDVVPHAEGEANPNRRNVTTVESDHNHHDILENHSIEKSYVAVADDADHSSDASIRDFVTSARDFLIASRATTHAYDVVRR